MTSVRSTLVGLTAALLLAPLGAATASTFSGASDDAKGGSRYDTNIRFISFDHTRGYGKTVKVRGQIVYTVGGDTGSIPGNKKVAVFRKLAGASNWNRLGKDYTDDGGVFSFKTRAKANASYRVKYAGNDTFKRSNGSTAVSVYRPFNAKVEDGGRKGIFHGRVKPGYGHEPITLEKRDCADCGWHSVRTKQTGDRGTFRFEIGAPSSGRWWWRATTPATTRYIKSYSSVFTTER